MKGEQQLAVEIFCSYAQEDELFCQQLEVHLKVLEQQGLILLWHDRQILPGLNVIETRNAHLKKASIILLLVSAYFIASCSDEMTLALKRHKAGEAKVIPIVIRPCCWDQSPIASFRPLPLDARPISMWASADEAWTGVTVGLQRVIEASSTSDFSQKTDIVPRIITSDFPPPTPSTFRLRWGGSPDLPLVIETHARLITIGRAPKNMVRLPDEIVSWEHGVILLKEGEYFYSHLSKSKPTILRRKGLEQLFRSGKQEETALRNQDRLIIGKTTLIIECDLINEDGGYRTTAGTEEEEHDAG